MQIPRHEQPGCLQESVCSVHAGGYCTIHGPVSFVRKATVAEQLITRLKDLGLLTLKLLVQVESLTVKTFLCFLSSLRGST